MSDNASELAIERIKASTIRRDYIKRKIDRRTLLEQLAEEAAELSQACLKTIRAERLNKNPTPLKEKDAQLKLQEELDDVLIMAGFVGLRLLPLNDEAKVKRWLYRIMEEEVKDEEHRYD